MSEDVGNRTVISRPSARSLVTVPNALLGYSDATPLPLIFKISVMKEQKLVTQLFTNVCQISEGRTRRSLGKSDKFLRSIQ